MSADKFRDQFVGGGVAWCEANIELLVGELSRQAWGGLTGIEDDGGLTGEFGSEQAGEVIEERFARASQRGGGGAAGKNGGGMQQVIAVDEDAHGSEPGSDWWPSLESPGR